MSIASSWFVEKRVLTPFSLAVPTDVGDPFGAPDPSAEVRGPAEAIVMALLGRAQALTDLAGPGVTLLAGRM